MHPLARPLVRPLAASLVGSLPGGLHPTAKAIIDALVAAGATVTGQQSKAIDVFVRGEIDAGRWGTSIKRFWLPVWGVAAANAICWQSLNSGTWVGTVTHAAGYVQGNGSTGYFNMGVSPSGVGMTTASGSLSALVYLADSRSGAFETMIGAADAAAAGLTEIRDNNIDSMDGFIGLIAASSTGRNGIYTSNRSGASALQTHRRTQSGFVSSAIATGAQTVVPTSVFYGAGRNVAGVLSFPTNARIGAWHIGVKFDDTAAVEAFTSNLKTLWEAVTGLTLP